MRCVNLADYTTMERPQLDWIIPGYLALPSYTLLLGSPKAGKSFLALQIAMQIGSGRNVFGQQAKQKRVLYIQLDTPEIIWRHRLLKLEADGENIIDPDVFMPHPDDFTTPCNVAELKSQKELRACLNGSKPDVVIIDVLRELTTADENDSSEMKKFMDHIHRLFQHQSVIMLHHVKKCEGSIYELDPIQVARGSSYLTGRVDAFWLLHEAKLKIVSRMDTSKIIHFDRRTNGFFDYVRTESIGGEEKVNLKSTVVAHLKARPELTGLTHQQMYDFEKEYFVKLGITKTHFLKMMTTSTK